MRKVLLAGVAFVATLFATAAMADDTRQFGNWTATTIVSGSNVNCTIYTTWGDGSQFYVKKFHDAAYPVVELSAPYWTLNPGVNVPVVFHFDRAELRGVLVTDRYHTSGESLMRFEPNDAWFENFRTTRELVIQFPNSGEGDWPKVMRGSAAALNYMTDCVAQQASLTPRNRDPFGTAPTTNADPFGTGAPPVGGVPPRRVETVPVAPPPADDMDEHEDDTGPAPQTPVRLQNGFQHAI